jgi:hypothetical protein
MIARTLRPLRLVAAPRIQIATKRITPVSFRTLATESSFTPSSSQPPITTSQEIPSTPVQASPIPITEEQANTPPPAPRQLPYFVGRNQLNNLSVYQRKMRGGNLKKTLLKRGEGNMQALRNDVAEALTLSQKEVTINNVTRHIEVKVNFHTSREPLWFYTNSSLGCPCSCP